MRNDEEAMRMCWMRSIVFQNLCKHFRKLKLNNYNLKMDVTEQELQMTQEFLNDLLSDTRKESIIRIIGKLRQEKCRSVLTIRYLENLLKREYETDDSQNVSMSMKSEYSQLLAPDTSNY